MPGSGEMALDVLFCATVESDGPFDIFTASSFCQDGFIGFVDEEESGDTFDSFGFCTSCCLSEAFFCSIALFQAGSDFRYASSSSFLRFSSSSFCFLRSKRACFQGGIAAVAELMLALR